MAIRGVRGATTANEDNPEEILRVTCDLLQAMVRANPEMHPDDLASVLFTASEDLISTYPARAARDLGWDHIALMCAREIPVPGSVPRCIRVLIHWNTDLPQDAIRHVYMGAAANLRPDLSVADSQLKSE